MMCPDCGGLRHSGDCPDLELLAHDVERSVSRYMEAAANAPNAHANEWHALMDTGAKLNQFLIRTRPRRVA